VQAIYRAIYRLKERSEAPAPEVPSARSAFIELPVPAVVGKQCLIEVDSSTGARMRVQLVGYDADEIEPLARILWAAD
jgi:hypothetical protein